jgi:DNA-directed RNA polymerase specialized sigma24 family protein
MQGGRTAGLSGSSAFVFYSARAHSRQGREAIVNERDRSAARVAELRSERGPDPVPVQPRGLDVPAEQWDDAWVAVLLLGLRITSSNAHADDLRQEAYARLMTTRPWRRDEQPSFVTHMVRVAASVLKHDQKAHVRRTHHEADAGAEYKRDRGDTAPPDEEMIEHAENRRRQDYAAGALAELRRRLAEHPLELRIVDHLAQELDEDDEEPPKPAEVARALGVPVGEVYRA